MGFNLLMCTYLLVISKGPEFALLMLMFIPMGFNLFIPLGFNLFIPLGFNLFIPLGFNLLSELAFIMDGLHQIFVSCTEAD